MRKGIKLTKEKGIIYTARIVSAIFNPFYLALVGLILLFTLSYMSEIQLSYRLRVLGVVFGFTILMPTILIRLYRHYQGWTLFEISFRHRRVVPYIIAIGCYLACVWFILNQPVFQPVYHFSASILIAALVIQVLCAIINIWWKISTHTAAIGGVAGALIAFAEKFMFNPVWWLCLVLVVAGVLGSARIILRQHTPGQVLGGFLVGFVCAFICVTFL